MHGKAQADQWQRYIRENMARVLSGGSVWLLFGLAFIVVVYGEVFETILFYAALWTEGNGGTVLAGALSACAALAVVAWAMLRYSRQLPIGKFFTYSSWLMAVLTVVLAGKGIAALQEAGIVSIAPLQLGATYLVGWSVPDHANSRGPGIHDCCFGYRLRPQSSKGRIELSLSSGRMTKAARAESGCEVVRPEGLRMKFRPRRRLA
jgi:FTR1 family protein